MGSFLFCKRLKINVLFLDGMKRNIMDENRGFSIPRTFAFRGPSGRGAPRRDRNALRRSANVPARRLAASPKPDGGAPSLHRTDATGRVPPSTVPLLRVRYKCVSRPELPKRQECRFPETRRRGMPSRRHTDATERIPPSVAPLLRVR